MTTKMQVKIVKEHIDEAKAKGAKILTGSDWDGVSEKIPPIVIEEATPDMLVASEETFGPVIVLFKFHEEAVSPALLHQSVNDLRN